MKRLLQQTTGKTLMLAGLLLVAVLAMVSVWYFGMREPDPPPGPALTVTLALPTQLSAGAVYVGREQDYFSRHGVQLIAQPFALGKLALEAVLQGRADLALVADTPFMLAAMRGRRVAAVATVFGSRKTMAILARRSSAISAPADIRGKTIGTVFGTNAQYFLHALMVAHGIGRDEVRIVDYTPDALVAALRSGRVDGATLWHPDLGRMELELGAAVAPVYAEDIFIYRFLLVGTPAYIDANGPAITRLLRAMEDGNAFIRNQPGDARRIIGRNIGIDPGLLATAFQPSDYQLTLDQSLLLTLDDQTRWAIKEGIVAPAPVPNYLDMVRTKPLQQVRPNAIRIIN